MMPAGHGYAHGHSHGHSYGAHGHRECSTSPPPPDTVDLERLHQHAEAERKRWEKIERATNDRGEGLPPVVEITPQTLEVGVVLRSEQVPVTALIGMVGAADSLRLRVELRGTAREANSNWILTRADAEEHPQLVQAFGMQAVPVVTAVAMGSLIGVFIGEKTRDWLEQWLAQAIEATRGCPKELPAGTRMAKGGSEPEAPEPTDFFGDPIPTDDPRLEQVEELLEESNFDGALELYDAMLQLESVNQGSKRAHASMSLLVRAVKTDRSADPIAKADAAPKGVVLTLDVTDVTMLIDDPAEVLGRLLKLLPQVFGNDREAIKLRLLGLLVLLDTVDPVILDAHRRMASALY